MKRYIGLAEAILIVALFVDVTSAFELGVLSPKEMAELEEAVQDGDRYAMVKLGLFYLLDLGVKQDFAKAHELFEAAADKGYADAMFCLGRMYATGNGVEKDWAKAEEWFDKYVEIGGNEAILRLAFIYAGEAGLKYYFLIRNSDVGIGLKRYGGCITGLADAGRMKNGEYDLTYLTMIGHISEPGIDQNWTKVQELFESAAEKGNADAMLCLGKMYADGDGVEKNTKKAEEWFSKGAENGDANDMLSLALMYLKGDVIEKDEKKVAEWYEKAANKGNTDAMAYLAQLYVTGNGVEKDLNKALEWYTKSANEGNVYAMSCLGRMYRDAKDVKKAREWFEKVVANAPDDMWVKGAQEELERLGTEME